MDGRGDTQTNFFDDFAFLESRNLSQDTTKYSMKVLERKEGMVRRSGTVGSLFCLPQGKQKDMVPHEQKPSCTLAGLQLTSCMREDKQRLGDNQTTINPQKKSRVTATHQCGFDIPLPCMPSNASKKLISK